MLKVENLSKKFGIINAVDDISFEIEKGEIFSLVGESGCGKTTTGRLILRLLEPDCGRILFEGIDILKKSQSELKKMRKNFQIIFQDPYTSLNPRMRVGDIIEEPLKVFGIDAGAATLPHLLEMVGLPLNYVKRFPHELSGGERQRVGIARAIILNPKFLIADEVVSSLDVIIQAQILDVLKRIKSHLSLTILFIAHDLAVVGSLADRVAVMNHGKIVEIGNKDIIFSNPSHSYTKKLLCAVPIPDPIKSKFRK